MGRTILSATQTWVEEEKALARYLRALRKSDQSLLQELLALSRQHIAEASYASNLYPMDIYLVSMILEMYKKIKQLETRLEGLGVEVKPVSSDVTMTVLPSLMELVSPNEPPKTSVPGLATESGVQYVDCQDGA
jgi:hypothetical protein